MYALGKKGEMLFFTGVYVCVKAKLTFVRFFSLFFFCTFPLGIILGPSKRNLAVPLKLKPQEKFVKVRMEGKPLERTCNNKIHVTIVFRG